MNIALGALIITIFLLPGAVILLAYYSAFREKDKSLHIPFGELLFKGLVYSFFVHYLAIQVMDLFGVRADFRLMYQIIIADKVQLDNVSFTKSFLQFGFYNLVLYISLFSAVKMIRRGILHNNLDIKFHSLRTSNFWFLVFSGRYLDANKKGRKRKTDLIWVDIMATKNVVYSGFLFDFEYSPSKDELETITLKNAKKRTYFKPENINGEIHPLKLDEPRSIQGDAFVIFAKDIQNINLYYLNLAVEEIEAAAGKSEELQDDFSGDS